MSWIKIVVLVIQALRMLPDANNNGIPDIFELFGNPKGGDDSADEKTTEQEEK